MRRGTAFVLPAAPPIRTRSRCACRTAASRVMRLCLLSRGKGSTGSPRTALERAFSPVPVHGEPVEPRPRAGRAGTWCFEVGVRRTHPERLSKLRVPRFRGRRSTDAPRTVVKLRSPRFAAGVRQAHPERSRTLRAAGRLRSSTRARDPAPRPAARPPPATAPPGRGPRAWHAAAPRRRRVAAPRRSCRGGFPPSRSTP